MRRGPAPQREPMNLYLSAPKALNLLGPFLSWCFSVGRLPFFGACPLRGATIDPVPRGETWRPEAQGRGGWRQARAVGDLTRRGREGGRRGRDLLTQAGRFSPEEPHFWESSPLEVDMIRRGGICKRGCLNRLLLKSIFLVH